MWFSPSDVKNLRLYLESGGFCTLMIIMDSTHFLGEIVKVFPDNPLVELPISHPIYNQKYKFPKGLPKIHEHDNKPPQGFGIFVNNRLVVYYTYESDISDGWNHPKFTITLPKREKALKMGANIIQYVFNH